MFSSTHSIPRTLSRRSFAFQCPNSRHLPRRSQAKALPSLRQRCAGYVAPRGSQRLGQFEEAELDKKLKNPYDEVSAHRQYHAQMHRDRQQVRVLAIGAITCTAITIAITLMFPIDDAKAKSKINPSDKDAGTESQQSSEALSSGGPLKMVMAADASKDSNETFQGRPVIVAPGGEKLVAHDEKTGQDLEVVPTGSTSIPHFPKYIYLPSKPSEANTTPASTVDENAQPEEYTLLGLGIRSVSFLSIKVYVVGLYVQTASLQKLQTKLVKQINPLASALIPGEKETLRQNLLDPEQSFKLWDQFLRDIKHGELDQDGINMAFRIVPTRSTDFNHLRDGWIRGITSKTQEAQRQGSDEYSDDSFGAAKRDFEKLLNGKGKTPQGSIVLLTRAADGRLGLLFQPREKGEVQDLGRVADERIARLIWLGYLGGKNVSSEDTRKSVVDGCIALVERPVGTVETKVA